MLQVGELFAGIGGIGLGLEMTGGFAVKWQVEIDEYATKVLEKNWPEAKRWNDVTTFPPEAGDWDIDVLAGGFPCQDLSYAGKGAGLDGKRSGLFYEVMRITERLRPRYLLLENVSALLTRGMDRVLGEVAEIGYDAEWHCIPAASVGAPHRRDRVFILAYPDSNDGRRIYSPESQNRKARLESGSSGQGQSFREAIENVAYPSSNRCGEDAEREPIQGGTSRSGIQQEKEREKNIHTNTSSIGCERMPEKQISREPHIQEQLVRVHQQAGRDQWEFEPGLDRVVNGVPNRAHRIRCLGNAVVPQVAEVWGRYILERER
tara:strand:+ start:1100 stop:2056 length:957 start_codon:yes stop_codon:yes gene_type:complete